MCCTDISADQTFVHIKKKKKNDSDSFFSDTISEFLDIRAYKTQRLVALVPEN